MEEPGWTSRRVESGVEHSAPGATSEACSIHEKRPKETLSVKFEL